MMVDLDESRVLQSVGDEASILPSRLRRCLKAALQLVTSTTQPWDASRNVLVSEAFVRMFVEVCGHYRNHIVTQQDSMKVFEVRETSVTAVLHLTKEVKRTGNDKCISISILKFCSSGYYAESTSTCTLLCTISHF